MAVSMCSVTSPSSAISGSDMYLKRPLQSDVDEADFEPTVKIKCPCPPSGGSAGGGRRKQSKPIRVRSEVDPAPVEDLVVDMKVPATQSDSPAPEACQEGPAVDLDDQKPAPDTAGVVFPTRYHQLGSELKQEVGLDAYEDREASDVEGKDVPLRAQMVDDFPLNELARSSQQDVDRKPWNQFPDSFYASSGLPLREQSFVTKSECLPTNLSMRPMNLNESARSADPFSLQTSARPDVDVYRADMQDAERFWEGSENGNGAEKSRIFHPDAYCDICDREFCNKYFLKTHRANKHGIYDGASTDAGGYSSSAAVPPSMSALVFSQAALPSVEHPSTSLVDRERATSSSVSCSSSSSLSGVLPIPQLPSSLGMLPFDDPPLPAPPRSSDMEDYCDICQKHFCNKYYLRKHRQDVHGLSPADVASRRSQSDFTRGSDVVESSNAPHFPLRVSSSASSSTLPPPAALSNFPMFLPPPFGAPLPVVPPFLPGAAGLGFSSLPFNAGGTSSKLSTSSTSQPQPQTAVTSSLLPGMLSPDAYMDLFRKEILGGYLLNNGDQRDVIAAVAAAAAAAATGKDPSVPGPPPRLPVSEPSPPADTPSKSTPDTFAEMLQRIGARIGKKSDVGGALQHDLLRLNGLGGGPGAVRLPGSLTSAQPSSTASRLVDRVVCDLCNKEVCNKYFLKTHKMKVHGWDPNTSTVVMSTSAPLIAAESTTSLIKSEPPPTPSQPPEHIYLPPLPASQLDKPLSFPPPDPLTPKDVELQKMGIDPEAYCEICRKEFCSKYFLRTHRQNIHGIQENSNASSSSSPAVAGPSIAPSFVSTVPQPFSSVVLPPPAPPLVSLPSSLSINCSSSYLFGAAGNSTIPTDGHMTEERSWKWKEPVNATRVSCTLCNKVLCNKYFLRTHMAKRHGVSAVDMVQATTIPPSAIQTQLPQSHQPSTNGIHQSSVDMTSGDERKEVECCTDGGTAGGLNLMMSGRASADVQTVTARTWHVPANESESGTLQCDGAYTTVKCPLCALALCERDALLRHLSEVHHVDDQMSVSLISAVAAAQTGSDSSGSPDGLAPPRPPTTGSSGGLVRRRRQFRCSFCHERFRTRVHCELHARAAHNGVSSANCVEVTPAVDMVETQSSPPLAPPLSQYNSLPPVYATPLDPSDSSRSQMLPFVLREVPPDDTEPRFSTTLVYLPTFRPLTSPTNVTFTLTPIVQPSP